MLKFSTLNLDKHYSDICELWKERNLPVVCFEFLSPYGCVASKDDKVVGAFFIYLTLNTPIYMIRFPVVDKNLSKEDSALAINGLIDMTETIAKELGYTVSLCSTNHKGLIKRLEVKNYLKEFSDCVHMTKGV